MQDVGNYRIRRYALNAAVDTSWSAYGAAGGTDIPATEWEKYRTKAWRILQQATQRRVDTTTDAYELSRIPDALFDVADCLYALDKGSGSVASEKIGTYSVTYKAGAAPDPAAVAYAALAGTNLTYCGLSVPAYGLVDVDL